MRATSLLAVSLMVACASGRGRSPDAGHTPTPDAAHDGSTAAPDTGRDAGAPIDTGTTLADVGTVDDAGPVDDTGAPDTDAGMVVMIDGGMDAAATSDAGRDAGSDAAVLADAGRDAGSDAGRDAYVAPVDAGRDAAMVGPCTGGDCTSCGGGSFCAAGSCGANPTTLTYDFESGMFPTGWTNGTTGGTTPWRMVSSGAHGGTRAIESGAIGANGATGISFTISLASAATISFWLTTSSESTYDQLHFYVDGTQQGAWSGTTAWTQASYLLAAGAHTIEWRYTKDGSINTGSDAVWVDDVTIVSGGGNYATGFESTSLPAGYATSGSASWTTTTTMPHTGTRCAQSGTIIDSETTSMTTTVVLPAASTLTFWYRVSSESTYDTLGVYVDGTLQNQWSGTVAWTMASYPIAAGTHTVEWRYSKDGSVSSGSDAAWVDDVDFHYTPVVGPLCM